jgi:hypothetical protein
LECNQQHSIPWTATTAEMCAGCLAAAATCHALPAVRGSAALALCTWLAGSWFGNSSACALHKFLRGSCEALKLLPTIKFPNTAGRPCQQDRRRALRQHPPADVNFALWMAAGLPRPIVRRRPLLLTTLCSLHATKCHPRTLPCALQMFSERPGMRPSATGSRPTLFSPANMYRTPSTCTRTLHDAHIP